MVIVADLMPASSPGCRSTTSALKPPRSHHRRYMRIKICAQSCDSVPPAPGWIDTIASFTSWGPPSMIFSSKSSSARRARATPSSISGVTLSSPVSAASSKRTPRSWACVRSSRNCATVRESSDRSRTRSCARRLSSRKAGVPISASMTRRRSSLASRSKVPPEAVEPTIDLGDVALELTQHGDAPARTARPMPRCTPRRTSRRAGCTG